MRRAIERAVVMGMGSSVHHRLEREPDAWIDAAEHYALDYYRGQSGHS